jgi:hypothetical protein
MHATGIATGITGTIGTSVCMLADLAVDGTKPFEMAWYTFGSNVGDSFCARKNSMTTLSLNWSARAALSGF